MSLIEFLAERARGPSASDFRHGHQRDDDRPGAGRKLSRQHRAGCFAGAVAAIFTRTDEGYRISKKIRDLCVFARQNVCADPPFSNMDLISCQNVLIYFGPRLQKQIIPTFHYALKPRGFLLLSPAESVGGFSDWFTQADKKQRLYVKQVLLTPQRVAFSPKAFQEETDAALPVQPAPPESLLPDIEKAADRILLRHYTPAGVIIDLKMQVLQFRGFTSPYARNTRPVSRA